MHATSSIYFVVTKRPGCRGKNRGSWDARNTEIKSVYANSSAAVYIDADIDKSNGYVDCRPAGGCSGE